MTSRRQPDEDRTLGDLLRTVRTNARLTILVCVGLMTLAVVVVGVQPPTYVASSQVLVPVAPAALVADPRGRERVVSVDTEALRAYSDTVLAEVAQATDVPDPRKAVRVSALPVSRVLVLEYRGSDRALVETGVRAWTDAYVREQAAFVEQRSVDALDALGTVPIHQVAARSTALAGGDPSSAWRTAVTAQSQREFILRDSADNRASMVKQRAAKPERKPWETRAATALMIGVLVGFGLGIRRRWVTEAGIR